MHAFDRRTDGQTDGQTEFPSLYRDCIPCSEVKIFITYDFYVVSNRKSCENGLISLILLGHVTFVL